MKNITPINIYCESKGIFPYGIGIESYILTFMIYIQNNNLKPANEKKFSKTYAFCNILNRLPNLKFRR